MTKPTPKLIKPECDRHLNPINDRLAHRWRPHNGTFVQDFAQGLTIELQYDSIA